MSYSWTPQAPSLNQHKAALTGPLVPLADGSSPATTVAAGSDGDALPQATINVADTTGFAASGSIYVVSDDGVQTITYTGINATQFTGCSGGTGVINTGNDVTQGTQVYLNKTFLGWSPELYPVIIIQCVASATVDVLGLDETTWCAYPGASDACAAGAMKILRGRWKALRVTTLGAVYVKGDLDWAAYNAAL